MGEQYQYRFLDVVIRKGEIAIWNKLRVAKSQKLFRKKYSPDEHPTSIAEDFIDQYWQEILGFDLDEKNWQLVKVLQQNQALRDIFLRSIFDLSVRYQKLWHQNIYVRFAHHISLKVSKSAQLAYQIESEDIAHKIYCKFDGTEILDLREGESELNDNNGSVRFSIDQLQHIWLVY